MLVAVTGASGHVGSNLARALVEKGHRVRALVHDDGTRGLDGLDVERVPGDVLDPASLARLFDGAALAFHLAARIWILADANPAVERVNLEGTRNVLAAVRAAGVGRLVHFSSIHAFAPRPLDRIVDEKTPLVDADYHMPYDRSKAAAQREVLAAAASGLDVVVLQPTAVMGPGDPEPSRMGQLLVDLWHGRLPALPHGGFDWVDVRDVVAAALAAADPARARAGESYVLGGHWASMRELAEMAGAATGRPMPRFVAPRWLARLGAPFATAMAKLRRVPPRYTLATLDTLEHYRRVDCTKAERDLGYTRRPTRETVADTYAWFRATGRLP